VSDKPPFDPVRAVFFLVSGVIAVQCFVILAGVFFCWSQSDPTRCADLRSMLSELLMAALASAMAFSGGYAKKDK
jgi:hypothetical protein